MSKSKENRKQQQQQHQQQRKNEQEDKDAVITFAESISKLTVTDDAPQGMLAEWAKNFSINADVRLKLKNKKENEEK